MGLASQVCTVVMAAIQVFVLVYALTCVRSQIDLFQTAIPRDMKVVVTQDPSFWMPLHALIPTNCSEEWTQKKFPSERDSADPDEPGAFQIEGCSGNITFRNPTTSQNFFAMVFLQTGGGTTVDEIIKCRTILFWLMAFNFVLAVLLSLLPKLCGRNSHVTYLTTKDSNPEMADQWYPEVKPDESGMCENIPQKAWKAGTAMIKSVPFKLSLILQQFTILSLFAIFGQGTSSGPYLLMSYVPFLGYAFLIFLTCGNGVCMFLTLCGCEQAKIWVSFFGCCSCVVQIPYAGYSFYLLNFQWNVFVRGSMKGTEFFSAEWPSTMHVAGGASKAVFGVNAIDVAAEGLVTLLA